MDKLEKFQVGYVYGEYVQKSISDCVKDFENELEISGFKLSLIDENKSIKILSAYINSEVDFFVLHEDCRRDLEKIMPNLKKTHINHISTGILKTIILKHHHKLFSKDAAIDLAIEVFHQTLSCMEIRNNFNYNILENEESFAMKGANKRHQENRKIKEHVFKWLDKNFHAYKSMDAAAEAIAGKEVNMSFRTVRQWITEWKKLRSAGTA